MTQTYTITLDNLGANLTVSALGTLLSQVERDIKQDPTGAAYIGHTPEIADTIRGLIEQIQNRPRVTPPTA